MNIQSFLNQNAYADSTKDQYRWTLKLVEEELGPDISGLDANRLLAWLNDKTSWGGAARWRAFSAIRAYLRWEFGDNHPALKLRIRREPTGPQRALTVAQAAALLNSFDLDTPKGIRDMAMACLLLDTGLRCSEAVRVEERYVNLWERTLTVIVKGGQWGYATFSPTTAGYLSAWVDVRKEIAHRRVKNLFISIGGLTPGTALTPAGLKGIVRKWGETLGIDLSPHDFRRSFATLATRAGAPTRIVQAGGRWKSIEMVERYTQTINPADIEPYSPVRFILDP